MVGGGRLVVLVGYSGDDFASTCAHSGGHYPSKRVSPSWTHCRRAELSERHRRAESKNGWTPKPQLSKMRSTMVFREQKVDDARNDAHLFQTNAK